MIAVLLQLVTARLVGSWLAGAWVATSWAVAREITQAEYRWIDLFGAGLRENMPWWAGIDYRVWQRPDSWLDWAVPCAATFAICAIANKTSGRRLADSGAPIGVDSTRENGGS